MLFNKIVRASLHGKFLFCDASAFTCSVSKLTITVHKRDQSSFNQLITKDASKVFFSDAAQKLMKQLTEFDVEKIFRTRTVGSSVKPPKYAFMTNEELKIKQEQTIKRGYQKLQMPPIVPVNLGEVEVLDDTPELVGYAHYKHVFTDISYGISDKKRFIVVREPSGVLRKAFPSERHRMNEIYFSRPGRMLQHPRMFEKEHLENVWKRGEYEFVLDRACCQFEPDDQEFQDVTFSTYEKVNEMKAFQQLRSTRHFGTLVFYLCVTKNLDNLIEENLNTERINEAVLAVQLYSMVNEDCKFIKMNVDPEDKFNYLKAFLETESSNKDKLIDLLKTYEKEPLSVCSNQH